MALGPSTLSELVQIVSPPAIHNFTEYLVRSGLRQDRFALPGCAAWRSPLARLGSVEKNLTYLHTRVYFEGNLADIRELQGEASGKPGMNAGGRLNYESVPPQRGFSGDICRKVLRNV